VEFPHLVRIDKEYRKRGVQVISVPLERDKKAASQWRKDFKAAFPFVYDPQMKIAQTYEVEAIPFNVAIDRNGKVVRAITGANTQALEAAVRQIARKK
jgi:alkyl hydroperoxide reductase subunit AhpC